MTARILIVEDDLLIAMDLQKTLEDWGYQITSVVSTGEGGIQEVEWSDVDLILMDIRLVGEMDGIDAAKFIRSRFRTPIIFVTAATNSELNRLAEVAEPWECVSKPFHEDKLHNAIQMALKDWKGNGH